jgi:hypothetical protein
MLQPLYIQSQTLLARVASAVIDSNAQLGGLLGLESSLFELFKGEPSALADLDIVAETRAANCWAEEVCGTGGNRGSSFCAVKTAAFFAGRLIKPRPDSALPVLEEEYEHDARHTEVPVTEDIELMDNDSVETGCGAYLSEVVIGQLLVPVQGHGSPMSATSSTNSQKPGPTNGIARAGGRAMVLGTGGAVRMART